MAKKNLTGTKPSPGNFNVGRPGNTNTAKGGGGGGSGKHELTGNKPSGTRVPHPSESGQSPTTKKAPSIQQIVKRANKPPKA